MKQQQIATLVLKLMGVYCLIQGFPMLGMLGTLMIFAKNSGQTSESSAFVASVFPGVIMLALGLALLIGSRRLGQILTSPNQESDATTSVSFEQLQVLAFSVVGILIASESLPKLPESLSTLLSWAFANKEDRNFQNTYGQFGFYTITSAIGVVLQAGLGVALFFRARGFANFWRSLRAFATPQPPQS